MQEAFVELTWNDPFTKHNCYKIWFNALLQDVQKLHKARRGGGGAKLSCQKFFYQLSNFWEAWQLLDMSRVPKNSMVQ